MFVHNSKNLIKDHIGITTNSMTLTLRGIIRQYSWKVHSNITLSVLTAGENRLSCEKFLLVVDGQVAILTPFTKFVDGLASLMAAYYVFNIAYPCEASATLDFIQR